MGYALTMVIDVEPPSLALPKDQNYSPRVRAILLAQALNPLVSLKVKVLPRTSSKAVIENSQAADQ